MVRYILIRIIWVFIILFSVLSINFIIFKLAPSYPPADVDARDIYYARQVIDGYMTERIENNRNTIRDIQNGTITLPKGTFIKVEQSGNRLRIYEPIPISVQYVSWLKNISNNNWGVSTRYMPNVPVFDILGNRIEVTLRLNLIALAVYIPVGLFFGIIAALKKDSITDNIISLSVMIFISIPSFVLMLFLVLIFGYQLGWLPFRFPAADVTGTRWWLGMVLPVLGLSFGSIAGLTRLTRAELSEVLTSEFVLLARTKGLSRPQAVIRHAMRNSLVPLVPSIIGSFIGLLSGSVIIEQIYSIPGAGRLYIQALTVGNYDFNILLGLGAFYTSIGLLASLLVDLSYGIVDPRIRMGARK